VFLRRSPDTATAEDIRLFQLHLAEQGVSICTRNRTMTGIAFLFRVTLRRPDIADQIEYIAEPQKIPLVLSPEEVRRLLAAAPGFKYRLLLSLTYGCGLRALEVVSLKVCDIDSAQMVIRIDQGKGRKDRYVMLPPSSARYAAALVEGGATAGLAVSRPTARQSTDVSAAQSHFSSGR
jgi:integrase/recombinase XerD